MSTQGLEVIDHTVQLTHEWINDLSAHLGWGSRHDALRILRATLTALRDHLSPEAAAQFSAQLPLLVRGMFYEGWQPAHTPVRERRAEGFTGAIETRIGTTLEYRGVSDVSKVLGFLNTRISEGEIRDVRAMLPEPIRKLWPGQTDAAA